MNDNNILPINNDIPLEVVLKWTIKEKNKVENMYNEIKQKYINALSVNKKLTKRINKYINKENEKTNIRFTEKEFNILKERNKKLSKEIAKLRKENSQLISEKINKKVIVQKVSFFQKLRNAF
jgi:hypothetical protein